MSSAPKSCDAGLSQQQFLSLFLRSEREVFRYVSALVPNVADAEDIVQQTAIALWEKFVSYDATQPFTPWACRFALNKARQWMERRQRWQTLLQGGLAEELLERREALQPQFELRLGHLENCLAKLPNSQRKLVEGFGSRTNYVYLPGQTLAPEANLTVASIAPSGRTDREVP